MKLSVIRWLKTGSNPDNINQLQSHNVKYFTKSTRVKLIIIKSTGNCKKKYKKQGQKCLCELGLEFFKEAVGGSNNQIYKQKRVILILVQYFSTFKQIQSRPENYRLYNDNDANTIYSE